MIVNLEFLTAFISSTDVNGIIPESKILFILNNCIVLGTADTIQISKDSDLKEHADEPLKVLLHTYYEVFKKGTGNSAPEDKVIYVKNRQIKTANTIINTNEILIQIDSINLISIVPKDYKLI